MGGVIRPEILTLDKWAPVNFYSLFNSFVELFFAGNPRIDLESNYPYSFEEAKEICSRVSRDHGSNPFAWFLELEQKDYH